MEPTILEQIAALQKMPLQTLRQRWKALFGTDAPAYSTEHMVRRLAYRLQELHYGGMSDVAMRRLAEAAENGHDACRRRKRRATELSPGTRLIRPWRGQRHEVTVCHDGWFEYAEKRFRTLSAIAKAISGQHCSGPRFFGLPAGKETRA